MADVGGVGILPASESAVCVAPALSRRRRTPGTSHGLRGSRESVVQCIRTNGRWALPGLRSSGQAALAGLRRLSNHC